MPSFSVEWTNSWGSSVISSSRPCYRCFSKRTPFDSTGWAEVGGTDPTGYENNILSGVTFGGNLSVDLVAPNSNMLFFLKPKPGCSVSIVGETRTGSDVRVDICVATRSEAGAVILDSPREGLEAIYCFAAIDVASEDAFGLQLKSVNGSVLFDSGYPILHIDEAVQVGIATGGPGALFGTTYGVRKDDRYPKYQVAVGAMIRMNGDSSTGALPSGSSMDYTKYAWSVYAPSAFVNQIIIQWTHSPFFFPDNGTVNHRSVMAQVYDCYLNPTMVPLSYRKWGNTNYGGHGANELYFVPTASDTWVQGGHGYNGTSESTICGFDTTEFDKYFA